MKYAIDNIGSRIVPLYTGQRAVCPNCNTEVTGKIYKHRINHWAHLKKDCDNWHEPKSDWHVQWQNQFPEKNREIFITKNEISHRDDIRLDNGGIIEIQNSPLTIREVKKRESFYGKENLVWILNSQKLASSCFLKEEIISYKDKVSIILPKVIDVINYYDPQKIIAGILDNKEIGGLALGKNLYYVEDGNKMIFETNGDGYDFHSSWARYKFYARVVYESLYQNNGADIFYDKLIVEHRPSNRTVRNRILIKGRWRMFIDYMESPVFLDNLHGLCNDQIFDYKNKEVLDKKVFIHGYLKYT